MMKRFLSAFFVCIAAVLCGCATTEVSTVFKDGLNEGGGKPVAVVHAENYGYYLFSVFPLFAGDPDEQNANTMTFFSDTVTLENNRKMIQREAEKLGAKKIGDVRNSIDWTGSFSLWIVWRQVLSSSSLLTN